MAERLRALLEHPLDPSVARGVVALACAVLVGLAALFALAGTEANRVSSPRKAAAAAPAAAPPSTVETPSPSAPRPRRRGRRVQDPQDRRGSSAARRAARDLAGHRALQHVPYRRAGVAIDLAGARSGWAVLRVTAPSVRAARRGWRAFLRRYRDAGHSYIPLFDVSGRGRGGGA